MRKIEFREVKKLGGRPSVMELTNLTKKGNKTIIKHESAEFDAGIPPEVFSLAGLRRKI